MVFSGIHQQSVELKIVNYQFPEILDCEFDSNWLIINLNVESLDGNWQITDPFLMATELQEIITWLEELLLNKGVVSQYLYFIEPNLHFELLSEPIDDVKLFRIGFELECKPKFADSDRDYFVDVSADKNELTRLIADLKNELDRFPVRKHEQ